MPDYLKIIKRLELEEMESYAVGILESLDLEELQQYIPSKPETEGLSEDQIRQQVAADLGLPDAEDGNSRLESKVARKKLIEFLSDHEDSFAEAWENDQDTEQGMHPDETDEEFFEHEDPDKD